MFYRVLHFVTAVSLCAGSLPSVGLAQSNDTPAVEDIGPITQTTAQPANELNGIASLQRVAAVAAKAAELAAFDLEAASQAQAETLAEADEFTTRAAKAALAEQKALAAAELAASEAEKAKNTTEYETKAAEALAARNAAVAASNFTAELNITVESYSRTAEQYKAIASVKAEVALAAKEEAAAAATAMAVAIEKAAAAAESAALTERPEQTSTTSKEIELRSRDGLVSVTGILADFDANLITIETSYGVVGIEREGIDCFGSSCPAELLAER